MSRAQYQKGIIICLVGPSCSGKTTIINQLCTNPLFEKARSYTTRPRRPNEDGTDYYFIDNDKFAKLEASNSLLESTTYNGHRYGVSKEEIKKIIHTKYHNAVIAMDINGALQCQKIFGASCITFFIRRDKSSLIKSLIARNVDSEVTAERISTIDLEMENEDLCDWVLLNSDPNSIDPVVEKLLHIIRE